MGNKHPTEDISVHDLTGLTYEDLEQRESELREQEPECIDGPVTVLQMVTPLSPQSEPQPGEMYCNVTLEGEAFRLIPVELLPAEAASEEI